MIVYETRTNLNIWKPIVCGDNQNLRTKGEPGCQSLFFTNFCQPQKITGILGKAFPLISRRAGG